MNWLIDLTKDLRPYEKNRFLLAISGGLDSMALFHIFLHFRKHFQFDFAVAHFHHGPSENPETLRFRWQAFEFVKQQCHEFSVPFFSNALGVKSEDFLDRFSQELKSEDSMRKARYGFFEQLLKEHSFSPIVLAHHRDDLLETRMLRLIRGTGPEGLEAMVFYRDGRLRPLLKLSRKELKQFLTDKKGEWLEDPSNKNSQYLRNWLREIWFKELEEKSPGALASLARSLDLLASGGSHSVNIETFLDGNSLRLDELLCLSPEGKRQIMAAYMKSQDVKNYGLSHINEILKRLDREEKSHTFRLLGRCWIVDAGRMSLEKPS